MTATRDPPNDLTLVAMLCAEPCLTAMEATELLGLPDVPDDDDPDGDDDE